MEQEVTAPMAGQLPAPIESNEEKNVIDKGGKDAFYFILTLANYATLIGV